MRWGADERDDARTMALASLRHLHLHGRTPTAAPLLADSYLTDGRRLFRVIAQFAARGERKTASLEDCLTLEVQAYSATELAAMKLQPVTAAHRR
jgi:hypothetical protein